MGNGTSGDSQRVPVQNSLSGVAAVSNWGLSACGFTTAGGAWCWGRNDFGQLGDGTTTGRLTPVQVTGLSTDVVFIDVLVNRSCAVKRDGSAWCWGNIDQYEIGFGSHASSSIPVRVDFDLVNPAVSQQPSSTSVAEGGSTSFSVGGAGNPAPSIRWQVLVPGEEFYADLADASPFNSSPYTGVQTATLTIANASRALDGNRYRAVLTSDLGQTASDAATLTVRFAPSISTSPSNRSIAAGQSTTFAVTAAATAPRTYRWQVLPNGVASWSDVANGGVYSGADTSVLSISNSPVTLHRAQYRVVVTNSFGTATSNAAILTVFGPLNVAPSSLRFAATKAGASGALLSVTDPQSITIGSSGEPSAWAVAADQPWVQLSSGSGTGAGMLTVSIVNPNNVIGGSTALSSTITLTPATAGLATSTVTVTLTVMQTSTGTAAPFGQVDTPAQNATGVVGAIGVTGWALDDIGVTGVKIYRSCLSVDNPASCQVVLGRSVVFVGDASFLSGARPDIEAAFPSYPQAYRAGWGMQILTNMLPHIPSGSPVGGQGAMTLYAFATDSGGQMSLLGRAWSPAAPDDAFSAPTTVTLANDSIAKPFGTIDTPALGATVSGSLANFGWVLTPDSNTTADGTDILIPLNGSTITVYIDGVATGTISYNNCRGTVGNPVPAGVYCNDDISNIFGQTTPQPTLTTRTSNPTRFRNLDAARGAIGVFGINTSILTNGIHSIAWGVSDSAGRVEGIGSRNFFVQNSGSDAGITSDDDARALWLAPAQSRGDAVSVPFDLAQGVRVGGRSGFSLLSPVVDVVADETGERFVRIPQSGRLELQLGGGVESGHLIANGTQRDLPPGSHLDRSTGTFTWIPSEIYLGSYRLVFFRAGRQIAVTVTIRPEQAIAAGDSEIRMHVDSPAHGTTVSASLGTGAVIDVAGWALDPQAFTGSGIGAIHVWARRLDQPTAGPEFVGAATLGVSRPDVAAAFGPGSHSAGYQLTATLAPGLYELTVYAWNYRTARWEDARSVRITVRP
jgi:hypothetical protein